MRVLLLTHRLPYAPNRGDRIRAYHLLRLLRTQFEVTLVSLVHSGAEASHVSDFEDPDRVFTAAVPSVGKWLQAGLAVTTARPLTHALLSSPAVEPILEQVVSARPPDVVLAYCSGVAQYAVRPPLADVPLIVDMVDVDSRKWAQLAERTTPPLSWIYGRESSRLATFESALTRAAAATTVVNERERDDLLTLAPGAHVEIVGNGVDSGHLAPQTPPAEGCDVVFCGVMSYGPNEEGATWLARDVWPLVRAVFPAARLRIVGAEPTPAVRRLAGIPGVEITGRVPDVRRFLWTAAVAAAPLHVSRGVQNKVLEAVAAGLPVVVTPVVAAGLPPEIRTTCRVAETAPAFADALIALLRLSPEARRDLSRIDLTSLSWDRQLVPMINLLREAAGPGRRRL